MLPRNVKILQLNNITNKHNSKAEKTFQKLLEPMLLVLKLLSSDYINWATDIKFKIHLKPKNQYIFWSSVVLFYVIEINLLMKDMEMKDKNLGPDSLYWMQFIFAVFSICVGMIFIQAPKYYSVNKANRMFQLFHEIYQQLNLKSAYSKWTYLVNQALLAVIFYVLFCCTLAIVVGYQLAGELIFFIWVCMWPFCVFFIQFLLLMVILVNYYHFLNIFQYLVVMVVSENALIDSWYDEMANCFRNNHLILEKMKVKHLRKLRHRLCELIDLINAIFSYLHFIEFFVLVMYVPTVIVFGDCLLNNLIEIDAFKKIPDWAKLGELGLALGIHYPYSWTCALCHSISAKDAAISNTIKKMIKSNRIKSDCEEEVIMLLEDAECRPIEVSAVFARCDLYYFFAICSVCFTIVLFLRGLIGL